MIKKILICIIMLTMLVFPSAADSVSFDQSESEEGVVSSPSSIVELSPMISYKGRLLDSSSNPITGVVNMTFRLYDASTGGTLQWTETKNVQVTAGLFNTQLGDTTPLSVSKFNQKLWLEIVAGGETLTPRQQLLGAPYAFSLVPGAVIEGYNPSTPLLTLKNTGGSGIRAYSTYSEGVSGMSDYDVGGDFRGNSGVRGIGNTGYGGRFKSNNIGVFADSYGPNYWNDGVQSYSVNGSGVKGSSDKYFGGFFQGYQGIYAKNSGGAYAGIFDGDVRVYGTLTATAKSFVQDHPTDPTKEIIYVSLEGGEAGTYTRGSAQLTNGMAAVKLPEDFSLVTAQNGLTVQVTAKKTGKFTVINVDEVTNSSLKVSGVYLDGSPSDAEFNFHVNGVRIGYENYQPIQDKKPEEISARSKPVPAAQTEEQKLPEGHRSQEREDLS